MSSCCHPLCPCCIIEAIPIPADQPIMQIKDLDEVAIPTMEIKVKNDGTSLIIPNRFCFGRCDVVPENTYLHIYG